MIAKVAGDLPLNTTYPPTAGVPLAGDQERFTWFQAVDVTLRPVGTEGGGSCGVVTDAGVESAD